MFCFSPLFAKLLLADLRLAEQDPPMRDQDSKCHFWQSDAKLSDALETYFNENDF
jgi:hypothetical protein